MREIFLTYEINPSTWFYLSSLMIIGIFFKFYRTFSVRNLDLLALLFYGPGMLLIMCHNEQIGYNLIWVMTFFFLFRMLFDSYFVRRPMLEPNLSPGGMNFTCIALYFFLAGTISVSVLPLGLIPAGTIQTMPSLENQLRIKMAHVPAEQKTSLVTRGPGFPWFHDWVIDPSLIENTNNNPYAHRLHSTIDSSEESVPEVGSLDSDEAAPSNTDTYLADPGNSNQTLIFWTKLTACIGHLFIVIGIILVGGTHFKSFYTGVSAATLYLLMPYMFQFPSRIDHIIPGALLIWMVVFFRRPLFSGTLLGLATSLVFYPLFLFPLWLSFYLRRGSVRFVLMFVVSILVMFGLVFILSDTPEICQENFSSMLGGTMFFGHKASGLMENASEPMYLIPLLAILLFLSLSMFYWPSPKDLGALLSCSAAIMLAAQFCHPFQGGLYLAWYMPLLILTIFRPNLEDRIASNCVVYWGNLW